MSIQARQMETIVAGIGAQNDFRDSAVSIGNLQASSGAAGEILRLGPGLRDAGKLSPGFLARLPPLQPGF